MKKKPIAEPLLEAIGIAGLATTGGLVRTFASLAGERTVRRALESLSGRGRDRRKDGDGGWERVDPGIRCLFCGEARVVAIWRRLPGPEQVSIRFGHGARGAALSDLKVCEDRLPLHVYDRYRADWDSRRRQPTEAAIERRSIELWRQPTVHWALTAQRAQDFAGRLAQSVGPARLSNPGDPEVERCARSLIGSVMLEAIRLAGVAATPAKLPLWRGVAERPVRWVPGGDPSKAPVSWAPPRETFQAPGRRIWVTTPYDLASTAYLDSGALRALYLAQINWDRFTLPALRLDGRSPYQKALASNDLPRLLLVTRREDLQVVKKALGDLHSHIGGHLALKTRVVDPSDAAVYLLSAVGRKVDLGEVHNP